LGVLLTNYAVFSYQIQWSIIILFAKYRHDAFFSFAIEDIESAGIYRYNIPLWW